MYTVKAVSNQLLEIRMKYKHGDKFNFLLISDVHFDNPKCKRDLFFKHLDKAKEKNAGVLCFGDFFCLMQGKYDPRRNKKAVRPEHNKDNYVDAVFSDTAAKIAPWAKQFILFSDGNHETSVLKNLEINPLGNLVDKLNYKYNGNAVHMPYQGFVKFVFESAKDGGRVRSKTLYFHHGKFGGVVSKGSQGVGRHGLVVPDADIVVTGHTHDRWIMEQPRYRLKQNGQVKVEQQVHVKSGTYKEEFEDGGGWAIERIAMPKSASGGWWLEFEIGGTGAAVKQSFQMTN